MDKLYDYKGLRGKVIYIGEKVNELLKFWKSLKLEMCIYKNFKDQCKNKYIKISFKWTLIKVTV